MSTTHLADKYSYPIFQEFVDFIVRHVHIYNDLIYGGDALQEPGSKSGATQNTSSFKKFMNDHKLYKRYLANNH